MKDSIAIGLVFVVQYDMVTSLYLNMHLSS